MNSFESGFPTPSTRVENNQESFLKEKGRKLLYTWLLSTVLFSAREAQAQTTSKVENKIENTKEKIDSLFKVIANESIEKGLIKSNTNTPFAFQGKVGDIGDLFVDYSDEKDDLHKTKEDPQIQISKNSGTEHTVMALNKSTDGAATFDVESQVDRPGWEHTTYGDFATRTHVIIDAAGGNASFPMMSKDISPEEELAMLASIEQVIKKLPEDVVGQQHNTDNFLRLKQMLEDKEKIADQMLEIDTLKKDLQALFVKDSTAFHEQNMRGSFETASFVISMHELDNARHSKVYNVKNKDGEEQYRFNFDHRGNLNVIDFRPGSHTMNPVEEIELLKKIKSELESIK